MLSGLVVRLKRVSAPGGRRPRRRHGSLLPASSSFFVPLLSNPSPSAPRLLLPAHTPPRPPTPPASVHMAPVCPPAPAFATIRTLPPAATCCLLLSAVGRQIPAGDRPPHRRGQADLQARRGADVPADARVQCRCVCSGGGGGGGRMRKKRALGCQTRGTKSTHVCTHASFFPLPLTHTPCRPRRPQ